MSCLLLQGSTPSPEMGVVSDALGVAQQRWAEVWQSVQLHKVTVQASSLAAAGELLVWRQYHK